MTLDNYFKKLDPKAKIAKRLNSYQFKVSQDILGERIKLSLTPKQVAERINMSEKEYRSYENGIKGASKDKYLAILKQVRNIDK